MGNGSSFFFLRKNRGQRKNSLIQGNLINDILIYYFIVRDTFKMFERGISLLLLFDVMHPNKIYLRTQKFLLK